MINHWEIKGFCYWEKELSFDGSDIWINIGYSGPLVCKKINFQNVVALSGILYSSRFN